MSLRCVIVVRAGGVFHREHVVPVDASVSVHEVALVRWVGCFLSFVLIVEVRWMTAVKTSGAGGRHILIVWRCAGGTWD